MTITVSFSDDFKYARDTRRAGTGMSESTSRANETEGRLGETGCTACSSTYNDTMVIKKFNTTNIAEKIKRTHSVQV